MKHSLVIVTTVPETLATILKGQPGFLSSNLSLTLVTSPGKEFVDVAENEKVAISPVRMSRGISPFLDLVSIIKMVKVLRKHKPDIVHSYTPKAGLVAMLAAWLCRTPVRVHTFTGLIFPTQVGFRQKLLIWIDRLICACATLVVPEGEGVKRDLQQFGITKKELNVIGYGNIAGVDTDYYFPKAPALVDAAHPLRLSLGITCTDFVFCFVGRLNRDKGLRELIAAFVALPERAHLLLVGALDTTAPVDAATLNLVSTHKRIHHLGFLSDIRPALSLADILVLPSYREGFPNVVLQAGAMCLPVVATNINGSNEVIKSGWNGWLIPPRDALALQTAMELAMGTSTEVLQHMGIQARRRIQERFERKAHWRRLLEFYNNSLATMDSR